jgi:hypothetical protein
VRSKQRSGHMKWKIVRDREKKVVVKKAFAFLPIYNMHTNTYIWLEPYYLKRTYYYTMVGIYNKLVERIKEELVTEEEYIEYLKHPTPPWRRWKIVRVK